MIPNVSTQAKSGNSHDNQQASSNDRRYSLFGATKNISSSSSNTLSGLFSGGRNGQTKSHEDNNDLSSKQARSKQVVARRNTSDMSSSSGVCQRCKRFEVDLTNTSDNLSATDEELKASRQVISLLQRQLELFRVEKEGLEKLIISQSNKHPLHADLLNQPQKSNPHSSIVNNEVSINNQNIEQQLELDDEVSNFDKIINVIDDSRSKDGAIERKDLGDTQKILLDLIRTQLYAKDEEIVKLKFNLKSSQNDKEQLTLQLHLLEEDNAKLKSENSVLNENLALRDQTIVSLSNEVFEQGNLADFSQANNSQHAHPRRQSDNQISEQSFKAQRQIAKLIDTLDAYKKTNDLLSTNVTKLTERCTIAEKKEIETRSQCHELEAKCCQIQSKLLSLLKEIEQSTKQQHLDAKELKSGVEVICSESVKLLIKRLLEDKSLDIPLSWKEGNKPNDRVSKEEAVTSSNTKSECDELGFYIVSDESNLKEKPKSSIATSSPHSPLKRFSLIDTTPFNLATVDEASECFNESENKNYGNQTFLHGKSRAFRRLSVDATKTDEASWHMRWDNLIKDFDKLDLARSKEFKNLLRSGVPQEYRCKIWKTLVDLRIGSERRSHGPDYYQSLLEPNRPLNCSKKSSMNPSSKQIELDLLRTLPNNKHFETLDSSGTARLRRVLTAYSEHNPKVGYCQGMNRLAAVALLVLPEEEAFWCLSTIVDNIMPTGYYNDLWLAQVDSSVVMDFAATKLPILNEHFKKNNIELSLFAWFLTIFVDGTPPALFLRLWDSFLYEGDKILFRVALALLKMYECQLLQLNNSVAVNNFLRSTVNSPMNIDRFFDIAFEWINPLSTRSLRTKRQHNFQIMRSSFESRTFMTPSPSSKTSEERDQISKNDESPYEDLSVISV